MVPGWFASGGRRPHRSTPLPTAGRSAQVAVESQDGLLRRSGSAPSANSPTGATRPSRLPGRQAGFSSASTGLVNSGDSRSRAWSPARWPAVGGESWVVTDDKQYSRQRSAGNGVPAGPQSIPAQTRGEVPSRPRNNGMIAYPRLDGAESHRRLPPRPGGLQGRCRSSRRGRSAHRCLGVGGAVRGPPQPGSPMVWSCVPHRRAWRPGSRAKRSVLPAQRAGPAAAVAATTSPGRLVGTHPAAAHLRSAPWASIPATQAWRWECTRQRRESAMMPSNAGLRLRTGELLVAATAASGGNRRHRRVCRRNRRHHNRDAAAFVAVRLGQRAPGGEVVEGAASRVQAA